MHRDFIYIPSQETYLNVNTIEKILVSRNSIYPLDSSIYVRLISGECYCYSIDNLRYFSKITGDLNETVKED